jgi:sphingosine-1-phosphate phosphatase 1
MAHVRGEVSESWWRECMERAKDPERVWNFQERFGVQKVRVFRGSDDVDAPFEAIDHDDWTQKQAERRKRRESRNLSLAADRSEDEGVTSPVSSSGYSSSADNNDEENRNIVFYRIGSRLWYYLFFLGSQLGDETYYSIFFSFWFWNIDGYVGRR